MNQAFEKLDESMKNLSLDLMKYREDSSEYQQALSTLAQQYQAYKVLLVLAQDDINNTYIFKYTNISDIEILLANAGYLEHTKKTTSR